VFLGLWPTGRIAEVRILHIITGLSTGGAEMLLYRLLARTEQAGHQARVISLTDVGQVGEKIRSLRVPVEALGMRRGIPNPALLFRLACRIGRTRPDVIQTWMYHANLAGGLAARLAGVSPVVWGIHYTTFGPQVKRMTAWTNRICARLSGWLPARIVCCAETARRIHVAQGYDAARTLVIPNGIDLEAYGPSSAARAGVRQELGLAQGTPLIGLVARFDAQKDHQNFVAAAGRLHVCFPGIHFLLCGQAVTGENRRLVQWIHQTGARHHFHLLGPREDISRLTAALDIACSSSAFGEAFPLVIGEAMACAVPCVVTDVGDSACIVGDTGRVVPPKNPEALARAWLDLLQMHPDARQTLGSRARQRIQLNFSLQKTAQAYTSLYESLLNRVEPARADAIREYPVLKAGT